MLRKSQSTKYTVFISIIPLPASSCCGGHVWDCIPSPVPSSLACIFVPVLPDYFVCGALSSKSANCSSLLRAYLEIQAGSAWESTTYLLRGLPKPSSIGYSLYKRWWHRELFHTSEIWTFPATFDCSCPAKQRLPGCLTRVVAPRLSWIECYNQWPLSVLSSK